MAEHDGANDTCTADWRRASAATAAACCGGGLGAGMSAASDAARGGMLVAAAQAGASMSMAAALLAEACTHSRSPEQMPSEVSLAAASFRAACATAAYGPESDNLTGSTALCAENHLDRWKVLITYLFVEGDAQIAVKGG